MTVLLKRTFEERGKLAVNSEKEANPGFIRIGYQFEESGKLAVN